MADDLQRPDKRPDRPMIWFGKYMSLALTLPASVAGGYLFGLLLEHWWHHAFLRAVGILIGMAAGIVQVVRELSRDDKKK